MPFEVGWTQKYIGKRFEEVRPDGGYTCYDLVRDVYATELRVMLPSLRDFYTSSSDADGIVEAYNAVAYGSAWSTVKDAPRTGDVVWLVFLSRYPHCGVYVESSRMLHVMRGRNVCLERIDTPTWARRIVSMHRCNLVGRS
jgi:cell wall-associated NlpC family hydrolase